MDADDGQPKRQLTIHVKIVRYLSFIQRIQRLYMTEKTTKQMTWHKKGVRYNPDKMVHPSDGEHGLILSGGGRGGGGRR